MLFAKAASLMQKTSAVKFSARMSGVRGLGI